MDFEKKIYINKKLIFFDNNFLISTIFVLRIVSADYSRVPNKQTVCL